MKAFFQSKDSDFFLPLTPEIQKRHTIWNNSKFILSTFLDQNPI